MPLESSIVKSITADLKKRKRWYVKYHGSKAGRVGVPDLLCVFPVAFLALEVKNEDRKATRSQEQEMLKIANSGGLAAVVRSKKQAAAIFDWLDIPRYAEEEPDQSDLNEFIESQGDPMFLVPGSLRDWDSLVLYE